MRIGEVELGERPLFLAPMEDVTDPSFRYVCKQFGADVMYTEFINADGLIRDAGSSVAKLNIYDYERPIGIQLYGHIIESMVEAARIATACRPDIIDINFGCPVKKIANRGAGAGMLRDINAMVEMTKRIVDATSIPVTVKTRLGWDDKSKNIIEVAERLQDVGIKAITIHGRTRAQLYKGKADWTLIGAAKANPRLRIPVIGNGDVDGPVVAGEMFNRYGVDGIMVGRASFGRPWIFREIKHYISTGQLMEPLTASQKVEIARLHFQKSLEVKGPKTGILEMRRHFSAYFKGLPNFKEIRLKLLTSTEPEVIDNLLDTIRSTYGDFVADSSVNPSPWADSAD